MSTKRNLPITELELLTELDAGICVQAIHMNLKTVLKHNSQPIGLLSSFVSKDPSFQNIIPVVWTQKTSILFEVLNFIYSIFRYSLII